MLRRGIILGGRNARPFAQFRAPTLSRRLDYQPFFPRVFSTTPDKKPSASEPQRPDDRSLYRDQNDTWVDRHVSPSIGPYLKLARIDRPIGTMLLLWPCLWSIGLATPAGMVPDFWLMTKFGRCPVPVSAFTLLMFSLPIPIQQLVHLLCVELDALSTICGIGSLIKM